MSAVPFCRLFPSTHWLSLSQQDIYLLAASLVITDDGFHKSCATTNSVKSVVLSSSCNNQKGLVGNSKRCGIIKRKLLC